MITTVKATNWQLVTLLARQTAKCSVSRVCPLFMVWHRRDWNSITAAICIKRQTVNKEDQLLTAECWCGPPAPTARLRLFEPGGSTA